VKPFINHIVDHFSQVDLSSLRDQVIVFPSKRACYYFRQALLSRFSQQTFWMPRILSIEEFIVFCTGKPVSNEIDLLFLLYQAYSQTYVAPPDGQIDGEDLPTFDRFYAWGQVLLKDFDEVDRYLVNADELYRNLEQLRDLEIRYQDNEEVLRTLKRFNEMLGQEPTSLITNFSNQWSRVCKTYHQFRKALEEEGSYYSGMLYREMADELPELPFQKVLFAGFNALSKSEELIFQKLLDKGMATIFWDGDRLYLENEVEEAGKFMRRYYRKWPPSARIHWVVTDMIRDGKTIKLVGGVQSTGQAQVVGHLLQDLSIEEQYNCGVILADEGLLFPLLYALPENIEKLNVTMGYPAKHSHWFHLAHAYLEYQIHQRGKGHVETVYVNALLSNPLISRSVPASKKLRESLPLKKRWVTASDLLFNQESAILQLALTPGERVSEVMSSLVRLLISIYQKLRLDQTLDPLETEFAFHSLKHLMQLEERILEYHKQLEIRTLARLVVQAFEQIKIPFTGEPTEGLQLMGFLETRALDFRKIILVSVNEGRIPRAKQYNTYIPFAVRKAFMLPTHEEQDAIYAYHFKRILQRAKEVVVVYNTEVAIDGSGEKSRFIWQLKESFPESSISEQLYQMSMSKSPINTELKIKKNGSVLMALQSLLVEKGGAKSLSATAVRHYLDCSLRFYFRYVVKVRERDQESPDLDPRDFGNVVHGVLEYLYKPFERQTITRRHLEDLIESQKVEQAVQETIENLFGGTTGTRPEGKDILHRQIIQKLIYTALRKDLETTPFDFHSAELKLDTTLELGPGKTVRLEGTLDRVHEKDGVVHIVDYKTGRADLLYLRRPAFPGDGAQYVKDHFDIPRFKSGFQGFFYGLLWNKVNGSAPLKLGVYPLKKVNEGIKWLNYGSPVPESGIDEFERLLGDTLNEIFDVAVDFKQTEDSTLCRYCAYKEICQR
jgi:CRISPR/Cas system-associated exonuclease Cas4 (RecB family)